MFFRPAKNHSDTHPAALPGTNTRSQQLFVAYLLGVRICIHPDAFTRLHIQDPSNPLLCQIHHYLKKMIFKRRFDQNTLIRRIQGCGNAEMLPGSGPAGTSFHDTTRWQNRVLSELAPDCYYCMSARSTAGPACISKVRLRRGH